MNTIILKHFFYALRTSIFNGLFGLGRHELFGLSGSLFNNAISIVLSILITSVIFLNTSGGLTNFFITFLGMKIVFLILDVVIEIRGIYKNVKNDFYIYFSNKKRQKNLKEVLNKEQNNKILLLSIAFDYSLNGYKEDFNKRFDKTFKELTKSTLNSTE